MGRRTEMKERQEKIDSAFDIIKSSTSDIETDESSKLGLLIENINVILNDPAFIINDTIRWPKLIESIAFYFLKIKNFGIFKMFMCAIEFIRDIKDIIRNDYSEENPFSSDEEYNFSLLSLKEDESSIQYNVENPEKLFYFKRQMSEVIANLNLEIFTYQYTENERKIVFTEKSSNLFMNKNIQRNVKIYKDSLSKLELYIKEHIKNTKRNSSLYFKSYKDLLPLVDLENYSLIPFGSIVQLSHNCLSDLEVSLNHEDNSKAREHQKEIYYKILEMKEKYDNALLYETKRTKILSFVDLDTNVKIELMTNNILSIKNSEMIRQYCLYDSRVCILINIIKDWSKIRKLNGNKDGLLSSYCYTLLVIFFLQKVKVIPIITTKCDKYFKEEDITYKLNYDPEEARVILNRHPITNNSTVSELLIQFFYFYLNDFDNEKYFVNICSDKLLHRFSSFGPLNFGFSNKKTVYSFIDPFDHTYNPGQYFVEYSKEKMLKDEMRSTMKNLIFAGKLF